MDNNIKCRICLGYKKNVRSIFDSPSQDDYSFAHMITSIANVKVNQHMIYSILLFTCICFKVLFVEIQIGTADGITDKICLPCRKKLKEAHDFKLQIERLVPTYPIYPFVPL